MSYIRYDKRTFVSWIAGTGPTPVGVAAYRVADVTTSWEQAVALADSNYVGAYQDAPTRPGGRFMEFGFTTELRGSDTADVPPPDGALLRACAFAEAQNGTTPNIGWKYTAADPHPDTGTPAGETDPIDIHIWQDRLYRMANECVGSVAVSFIAGQIPTIRYTWRGQVESGKKGGSYATADSFIAGAQPKPVASAGLTMTVARTGTVTGTCTGTTSTTVLKDTAATFITDGVLYGDTITLTIGSETATVVSVDSETQITSTALSSTGTYDTGEAYSIARAASYATTSLVVPSLVYDVGNFLDPRPDMSGDHGFAAPIITRRSPRATMVVEAPSFERFNFERAYIEGETLDLTWTHEAGGGDRHAMTGKFSGVISAMPALSEQGGKLVYTVLMEQGIESGDDAFELSWQGT